MKSKRINEYVMSHVADMKESYQKSEGGIIDMDKARHRGMMDKARHNYSDVTRLIHIFDTTATFFPRRICISIEWDSTFGREMTFDENV